MNKELRIKIEESVTQSVRQYQNDVKRIEQLRAKGSCNQSDMADAYDFARQTRSELKGKQQLLDILFGYAEANRIIAAAETLVAETK